MQYKKYIFILLFASAYSSCKKYPEGPFFSMRTKEQRVVGRWKIDKYLIDGIDSTSSKFPSPKCNIYFDATGHGSASHPVSHSCDSVGGYSAGGYWDFSDHEKSITVSGVGTTPGPFFLDSMKVWKVFKLRFSDMHLQTEHNSKKYDIYLVK